MIYETGTPDNDDHYQGWNGNMEDASVGIRSGDWNGTWPTGALNAPMNVSQGSIVTFLIFISQYMHHRQYFLSVGLNPVS
jgi:hypothetical protein